MRANPSGNFVATGTIIIHYRDSVHQYTSPSFVGENSVGVQTVGWYFVVLLIWGGWKCRRMKVPEKESVGEWMWGWTCRRMKVSEDECVGRWKCGEEECVEVLTKECVGICPKHYSVKDGLTSHMEIHAGLKTFTVVAVLQVSQGRITLLLTL